MEITSTALKRKTFLLFLIGDRNILIRIHTSD
jgi:hypothetical protein